MKTTIQTSRGSVRFHSIGEPIEGIPADIGNPAKNLADLLAAAIAALTIVNREQPDGSIAADLLNAIRKATKGGA